MRVDTKSNNHPNYLSPNHFGFFFFQKVYFLLSLPNLLLTFELKMSQHSFQDLNKIYFWTAVIHKRKPLLQDAAMKDIIISSLKYLSEKKLIVLYAFNIKPNRIHIIWKQLKLNGKEKPRSSFLKFTAHLFLRVLVQKKQSHAYKVNWSNKNHCLWKRDSMAIELYSKKIMLQKLNYIHSCTNKEIKETTLLNDKNLNSSSVFYEFGKDTFGFLDDIFIAIHKA